MSEEFIPSDYLYEKRKFSRAQGSLAEGGTKITSNLCMSLCEFAYLHDSEGMEFNENPERSYKTAPFDRREDTSITGNLCLGIIIIIVCNSMYIIIYILTSITSILVFKQTLLVFIQTLLVIQGGLHLA